MSTIHKPRRKSKKTSDTASNNSDQNALVLNHETHSQEPAFVLVALFWPARKGTSQWVILPLILMVVGLFRWVVGFWGYSGTNNTFITHCIHLRAGADIDRLPDTSNAR